MNTKSPLFSQGQLFKQICTTITIVFATVFVASNCYAQPVKNLNTGANYSTLQAAIDASSANDVLTLLTDITEGTITINKDITVTSSFPFKKITNNNSSYGIHITSSGVELTNLILQGDNVAGTGKFGILTDCAADYLTVNSITVNQFGATGFAISGCDNSFFYNLTSTNNKGNGISITNCNTTYFGGITTSGNAFSSFSAGIGIFTSPSFCPGTGPGTTSNITITGALNLGEPVTVYQQAGTGTISNITLNPTSGLSPYTHYMGIGPDKFFTSSLAAAKAFASATLPIRSSLKDSVNIGEISSGNLYVYHMSPAMSIQAAINNIETGKTIIADGTFTENLTFPSPKIINMGNPFFLNGNITIASGATLKNLSQSLTGYTLTNNGTYTGKLYSGAVINNGTISPTN